MAPSTYGSVRQIQAAMREQLITYITALGGYQGVETRIYIMRDTVSSQLPRIEINCTSPVEQAAAQGATYYPVWHKTQVQVDIWAKSPGQVEETANYVQRAVGTKRNYFPTTVTIDGVSVNTTGNFYNTFGNGGTHCTLNAAKQLWHRTMSFNCNWLETS